MILLLAALLCASPSMAGAAETASADELAVLPLKALPRRVAIDDMVMADEGFVADLISEGLFDIGEGFEVDRVLVDSVSWRKEGRVLRIQLKRALFSDGTEVRADDVMRTLHRCIKNAEEALSFALKNIDGFEEFVSGKSAVLRGLKKISDRELEIETTEPSPLLPDALAFHACGVIKGASTDLLGGAIGTGAYKLESADADRIVLRKRKDYHRESTGPEVVEFRSTNHWGSYAELKDWATVIKVEGDPGITPGFERFENAELGSYQLAFNNSSGPFSDVRVRRAVAAALDIETLSDKLHWRKDRLQGGLFPFGMRGFKHRAARRDTALATRLLKEAGYSERRPLKFTITTARSKLSAAEAGAWPRAFPGVPIRVSLEVLEQKELVDRRRRGAFEALRIVKLPGTVDGHRLLTSYLTHSKFNTPRGNTPECDVIIKGSLGIADIDARYKEYEKADACLMARQILVPLASVQPGYVLLKRPWMLTRKSRYTRMPYSVYWWRRSDR